MNNSPKKDKDLDWHAIPREVTRSMPGPCPPFSFLDSTFGLTAHFFLLFGGESMTGGKKPIKAKSQVSNL